MNKGLQQVLLGVESDRHLESEKHRPGKEGVATAFKKCDVGVHTVEL